MRRGEHSHPLKPQTEVVRLLSEWQMERLRAGRAANQLHAGFQRGEIGEQLSDECQERLFAQLCDLFERWHETDL